MTHESSLMAALMRTIEQTARAHSARRVTAVRVQVGALVQISPDHLRDHVEEAARGTMAEGCRVEVEVLDDPADTRAQHVIVDSVELEMDAAENGRIG
jgi:hydrogenase nickel incorporation protein HypA/HybF